VRIAWKLMGKTEALVDPNDPDPESRVKLYFGRVHYFAPEPGAEVENSDEIEVPWGDAAIDGDRPWISMTEDVESEMVFVVSQEVADTITLGDVVVQTLTAGPKMPTGAPE
jgi:hypothetical protein